MTLMVGLSGRMRPRLTAAGRELVLVGAGGHAVLRYGGLLVTDARGRGFGLAKRSRSGRATSIAHAAQSSSAVARATYVECDIGRRMSRPELCCAVGVRVERGAVVRPFAAVVGCVARG